MSVKKIVDVRFEAKVGTSEVVVKLVKSSGYQLYRLEFPNDDVVSPSWTLYDIQCLINLLQEAIAPEVAKHV